MPATVVRRAAAALALLAALAAGRLPAQQAGTYPARPVPLADSLEIALAETAAPRDVASRATIWAVRDGKAVVLRPGTNGCACMVARDLHPGSLYPICYDAEGTRTTFQRELMEVRLRSAGKSEAEVRAAVRAAFADGTLEAPSRMSVAYMMSPRQVLFSSPDSAGRRVGAWWPHLMISAPGLTAAGLGLTDSSRVAQFQVGTVAGHHTELIVKLASWSDGTPVAAAR